MDENGEKQLLADGQFLKDPYVNYCHDDRRGDKGSFWSYFKIVPQSKAKKISPNPKISLTLSAPTSSKNLKVEEIPFGQVFYAEKIVTDSGNPYVYSGKVITNAVFIRTDSGIRALHLLGGDVRWSQTGSTIHGYVPVTIEVK